MARKFKSMDGNNAAAHVSYAFSEVAAKACLLLHRHAPRNPYCVRTVAAARKGVRQEPLLSRYRRSMKAAPDGGLLLKMAARMRGAGEE